MTVWCIGRNFKKHAEELGNDIPSEPLIFIKSGHCVTKNDLICLPEAAKEVHHEVEMALMIGENQVVTHAAVALDLTERAWQKEARTNGTPWTQAKSFKGSCPIGPLRKLQSIEELQNQKLELRVNGEVRQSGNTNEMIFQPEQILQHLKDLYPIEAGDLVLCGTPSGVGPLQPKDEVEARLGNLSICKWTVKIT